MEVGLCGSVAKQRQSEGVGTSFCDRGRTNKKMPSNLWFPAKPCGLASLAGPAKGVTELAAPVRHFQGPLSLFPELVRWNWSIGGIAHRD